MKISLIFLLILTLMFPCEMISAQDSNLRLKPLKDYYMVSRIQNPANLQAVLTDKIEQYEKADEVNPAILFKLMLGESYEESGKFILAEEVLNSAYEMAVANIPESLHNYYLVGRTTQKTVFDAVDRLAYFYLRIGNLRRSKEIFDKSMKLRQDFFPRLSVHRIHPVVGLGSYHFKMDNYNQTLSYFREATRMLSRATTTGYDFDLLNRLFLNDMVELSMRLGKEEEVFKYINKLSFASSGLRKYNSRIARDLERSRVFELKARYYLMKNNLEKARDYLERARFYYPLSLSSSDVLFKMIKTRALLYWYSGNLEQAGGEFKSLVDSYREHIAENFVAMSEYEKEKFYNDLKTDLELFNAFVADSRTLKEELYNNILNTKAILLNASNKVKNRILSSENEDLISKLKTWENAKTLLSTLYYQKDAQSLIRELESEIAVLEKEINRASGLFDTWENPPNWKEVQNNLGEDEAAIEIVRIKIFNKKDPGALRQNNGLTDSTIYMALLLKYNSPGPEFILLANGNDLERKYLPGYRNTILYGAEDLYSYDQFWKPLRKYLDGIRRLYLSPDGVYNQINLNTLKNQKDDSYVIDEIDLVYLTNTGDLLERDQNESENLAVLVGRPQYNYREPVQGDLPAVIQVYGTRNLITKQLITFRDQKFQDLPGTEEEITTIGSILKDQGMEVTTYKGRQALEEQVKAVNNPAILHLATHGFFLNDTSSSISPMILSGIVLAGVENEVSSRHEDGILTAYEATNLNLDETDIVVLSACQTGVGEVRNGEGVYGLQRAIIVAGAQNLLMSLWKVNDQATADLMTRFYRLRGKYDNQQAFRLAQIGIRSEYQGPADWGAFIMLGK